MSLAGSPHQRGSRTRVRVPALLSTAFTRNGPAVRGRPVRESSLKARDDPVTSFGYSGVNSDFQSA